MRTPMKWLMLQIFVLLPAGAALGMNTAELLDHSEAREIYNRKCIRLGTSELLPIRFETACGVLESDSLAETVQRELARSVAEDHPVAVPTLGNQDGNWFYTDEKGHRTLVRELYRKRTDEQTFDFIVWASGKRFFGKYDVIIHLQLIDAGAAGTLYSVHSHAYPHNRITRFSARNIGPVKRWFKKKMKIISRGARELALRLCEQEEFRKRWLQPTEKEPITGPNSTVTQRDSEMPDRLNPQPQREHRTTFSFDPKGETPPD